MFAEAKIKNTLNFKPRVYKVQGINIEKFYKAIVEQESRGDYTVINWDANDGKDPAIGLGQVLRSNIASWTKQALGRSVDPHTFRFSKRIQQITIRHRFSIIANEQRKAGIRGTELLVRRVAAAWYSGRAKLYDNYSPQISNGRIYPSIASYTLRVWEKYQKS